jgi:16S rRNA (guanine966-N2)-methyltransferase
MSLRIIGGRLRNHTLFSPKGQQTRPTSGLVRKAVFDICQADIEDARFLDLFAGSGAMGLEALSRGASHATFVDASRLACQCITKNLHHLFLEKEATVLCGNVLHMIDRLARQQPFTLIYIDPPYDEGYIPEVLMRIDYSPKSPLHRYKSWQDSLSTT